MLGLFNKGNMSLEWTGPAAATGKGNAPVACTEGQRPANEPSLAAMTKRAIDLLDDDKRKGFFLQVEGASIDKQDHATNACGQIGETVAFDRAIGIALDYQEDHPDTLVVVTADHSHTSQIVGEDAAGAGVPTGYSTNLLTKDGQTLSLTYGTAGYGGPGVAPVAAPPSQQHTGAVVPVWASGPGSLGGAGDQRPHRPVPDAGGLIWGKRDGGGPASTRPSFVRVARLLPMIVGFVGSGSMAAAIARGLGRASSSGCCSRTPAPAGPPSWPRSWGGRRPPTREIAERADFVVLAVKPAALDGVAPELGAARSGRLGPGGGAGRAARGGLPRGRSPAGDAERGGGGAQGRALRRRRAPPPEVREKLDLLGHVVEIADADFDAATAVMGCAPAYLALAVEAIADAGAADGPRPRAGLAS